MSRSLECYAANVRVGDTITGIWSEVRGRYDSCDYRPVSITREVSPYGVRLVTFHGRSRYETRTYRADTVVRVRVP